MLPKKQNDPQLRTTNRGNNNIIIEVIIISNMYLLSTHNVSGTVLSTLQLLIYSNLKTAFWNSYIISIYTNKETRTQVCGFSKVSPLGTDLRHFGCKVHDFYHKALLPFCGKDESYAKCSADRVHRIHQGLGKGAYGDVQDPFKARPETLRKC